MPYGIHTRGSLYRLHTVDSDYFLIPTECLINYEIYYNSPW